MKTNSEILCELFEGRKDAGEFLQIWNNRVEYIDDVVDEPKEIERLNEFLRLTASMYNCNYWKQYGNILAMTDRLIHITYFDSVKWENSKEVWKRRDARCLSHCALDMVLAVMMIEFGEPLARQYSILLRENAHLPHAFDKYE